ncbi:ankyrin domain protein [Ophiocordyceps camponoti-floridani]|uniref:Ankyrin domain protein n=1 Tax=Ophiocordyceps camponoti-floridani TaxID=2030778 RepID=A0A8H4Q317_9HYPO|nr:ankyrin domain protein [Ophiocordyceps camponoti-floridani]
MNTASSPPYFQSAPYNVRSSIFTQQQLITPDTLTEDIEEGDPVTAEPSSGDFLHLSARLGHERIASKLLLDLEPGAIDCENLYSGDTALHEAARRGNLCLVNVLLEQGAKISVQNHVGNYPLHLAAEEGHIAVIKNLLEKGASREAVNQDSFTPLHLAIKNRPLEAVETLLEGQVAEIIAIKNTTGQNMALDCALRNFNEDIIKKLVEFGADLDTKDEMGQTLLHDLASRGLTEAVSLLCGLGASSYIEDKENRTALYLAARGGHGATFQELARARNLNLNRPIVFWP